MNTGLHKLTDAQLLTRYAGGEEAAFHEIVNRYKNGLYAFLRQFLNRQDLVEDVKGQLDDVEKKLRSHNLENLIVQECPVCDMQVAEVIEEGLKCIGCGSGGHKVKV